MKTELMFTSIMASFLILILGCAQSPQIELSEYQPNSAEEKTLVNFLMECKDAHLKRNYSKWLDCYHENASIKITQSEYLNPMLSKQEYKIHLEGGEDIGEETSWVNPNINMRGDKAVVRFYEHFETVRVKEQIDIIKENGEWKIIRSDWWF